MSGFAADGAGTGSAVPVGAPYPVRLEIDYPNRELDRVSSGLRMFTSLPILLLAGLTSMGDSCGLLTAPAGLMLVFRERYPRWWFDWHVHLTRFQTRAMGYALLLDDRYPSADEEQGVHLDIDYPDARNELNRWMPLVKWLLALPHYVLLIVLWAGVVLAWLGAWCAILFTGRYPRALFDYVVGVLRWQSRVIGYAFTLVTDQYPPFRLAP